MVAPDTPSAPSTPILPETFAEPIEATPVTDIVLAEADVSVVGPVTPSVSVLTVNEPISWEKILEMAGGRVAYVVPRTLHFNVVESPIKVTYAEGVFIR